MCGIVGLFVKDPALEPSLGKLLAPMLGSLAERGPDSTGLAVYSRPEPGEEDAWRISLRRPSRSIDWGRLASAATTAVEAAPSPATGQAGCRMVVRGDAAVVITSADPTTVIEALRGAEPGIEVLSYGHRVEIIKDIGEAPEVCRRYGVADLGGYQGIGHTRMATESAVTPRHSHPFSPAADLCLVHNGSFSNHNTVRRRLQAEGVLFDSDNDSEVAARFIASRMAQGDDLEEAMRWVQKVFDGFFTLLVTSATQFAVVRDPFACKPATVAETERYVAMASEYRALAALPGITDAMVFEPQPEVVYTWTR
jgi:glutamate synthase domain-containing protein 1